MKIYIGADHNGYALKEYLEVYLKKQGYEVIDVGDTRHNPADDFPIYSGRVASKVLSEKDSMGILICGSGQGVYMAANRFKGIRASLVWNEPEAVSSRNDDDSNVLCLPANELKNDTRRAEILVDTWLNTPFGGAARYKRRIQEMDRLT